MGVGPGVGVEELKRLFQSGDSVKGLGLGSFLVLLLVTPSICSVLVWSHGNSSHLPFPEPRSMFSGGRSPHRDAGPYPPRSACAEAGPSVSFGSLFCHC